MVRVMIFFWGVLFLADLFSMVSLHATDPLYMNQHTAVLGKWPRMLSVQFLNRLCRLGDMRDDSAETLFQAFLQEALVSSSDMGRDVHFLMLSIQHFLCRPRRRPPCNVPRRMVLERLSWCVTCPNHASFRLLTVARRGSCGPINKLILFPSSHWSCARSRRYGENVTECSIFCLLVS